MIDNDDFQRPLPWWLSLAIIVFFGTLIGLTLANDLGGHSMYVPGDTFLIMLFGDALAVAGILFGIAALVLTYLGRIKTKTVNPKPKILKPGE